MRLGPTDRLKVVEQQLFDVHSRLERARVEVEFLQGQLGLAERRAASARTRMAIAETSLAQSEWCDAQNRVATARAGLTSARKVLEDLEMTRDALFAKLVG